MYTISRTFHFCYGHRLLGDHHPCRHLHGHAGKATVHVTASKLDERGMVFHFDELDQSIGRWIEEHLDHTMLLAEGDPALVLLQGAKEKVFALPFPPTSENLARLIFEQTQRFKLSVARVDFWESEGARATYEEK